MKPTHVSICKSVATNTCPTYKIPSKAILAKSLDNTRGQVYNKNHIPCYLTKGKNITMLAFISDFIHLITFTNISQHVIYNGDHAQLLKKATHILANYGNGLSSYSWLPC